MVPPSSRYYSGPPAFGNWYGRVHRIDNLTDGYYYDNTYHSAPGEKEIYNTRIRRLLSDNSRIETVTHYNDDNNRMHIRDMENPDEFADELERLERKMFDIRSKAVTEKLEDSSLLAKTKRDIARIQTILKDGQYSHK